MRTLQCQRPFRGSMPPPTQSKTIAVGKVAAVADKPPAVLGLCPGIWRCPNKKCLAFNIDPSGKSCSTSHKQGPQDDFDRTVPFFPALKKAGTVVVDLLTTYTGGQCPISKEDQ